MEPRRHLPHQAAGEAVAPGSAADLTDAERELDDQQADRRDEYAESADAAANARDRAADVRDAAAADGAATDILPTGQRRAARDRKAAANDRAQAGGDRSRARGDRKTARQARAYAAEDRSTAADSLSNLAELLRRAEGNATDMLPIGKAQRLLMNTHSLNATEALVHLCARAARDSSELGDAAKSILTEAEGAAPN